ncbi:apoptosis-associated speck-like protein containing a CARD [Mantella aurantiaca]
MARTVRDALLMALDDLGEKSFRRFRDKIMHWEIEAGFGKIPKNKLEKAESDDVVELIQSYYTDSYGPALTVEVLNAINEKQVALDLAENLDNVKGLSWRQKPKEKPQSTLEASSYSAPKPQVVSFVDKHREALIARIPNVAPILDALLSKDLLNIEENDIILAERISQDRMRKLYECMRQWSLSNKHTLYEILKEKNRPLIEDLEQS